jgi:glycosyltransferase involved in cell wall biosynthesis
MMYDVAIIIPTYNEVTLIEGALNAFVKAVHANALYVVVDNNSHDGTVNAVERWRKKNPVFPLVLLHEKKRGSSYARRKGLFYAKNKASTLISTDADCRPLPGFHQNIRKFITNNHVDILVGYQQHDASVRLLKQIYLPKIMQTIAWMEKTEVRFFGPFFFGGFFGIKSDKLTHKIFSISNLALPHEPSVVWSKHCYYFGYTFSYSQKTMRTSSRRFWSDPYGFISLQHSKAVRSLLPNQKNKIKILEKLRGREAEFIDIRMRLFGQRILLLLLDAIFYEKTVKNKTIISTTIKRTCLSLGISSSYYKNLGHYTFQKAKKMILQTYLDHTILVLSKLSAQQI